MRLTAIRLLPALTVFGLIMATSTSGASQDKSSARATTSAKGKELSESNDTELRRQLLRRTQTDQDVRRRLIAWLNQHESHEAPNELSVNETEEYETLLAAIRRTDEDNQRWMKVVVARVGWPTATMVGNDGAHAAWLLVQHADADPQFQRQCLDRMLELPKTEYSQADAAYLTDRVLLAEGKQQLYGTQFAKIDGILQPRPIADEAHVDKRRARVGLRPLSEYAKEVRAIAK